MAKKPLSIDLLVDLVKHVPEGYLGWQQIHENFDVKKMNGSWKSISKEVSQRGVGCKGLIFFDVSRMSWKDVCQKQTWASPQIPPIASDGTVAGPTIQELTQIRKYNIDQLTCPDEIQATLRLDQSNEGCLWLESFRDIPNYHQVLIRLQEQNILALSNEFVFDPHRVTINTKLTTYLTRSRQEKIALQHAKSQVKALVLARDEQWKKLLDLCGETIRPGAKAGKTGRMQVVSRSYRTQPAARSIGLPEKALLAAIEHEIVPAFRDPDDRLRISASTVEAFATQEELSEKIAGFIVLKTRDLAVACGVHQSSMYRRLQKLGVSTTRATWGEVRERWELPATYALYQKVLDDNWQAILQTQKAAEEEQRQILQAQKAREKAEKSMLRERLIATFPDWRHEQRAKQQVKVLLGEANSGKTWAALERLIASGSGWYLAPLRLLAYEIYDFLNRRGIACNLLTGEEEVVVKGAQITAATIEMFDAHAKGGCVVIDEVHMLGDPDRGWAWTRALMEARAEEMLVLGPLAVRSLVELLLDAVEQPFTFEQSSRLVPLRMATTPYKLRDLPARTIVVAFSRSTVLALKTDLEQMGRKVSIVYGALPPEVRRRQADRFASGETEICVATDAIGMGLNLPADAVCFYETQKYDGKRMRPLTAMEVHQIGGRAGRFGLAEQGVITALNKGDLDFLRQQFEQIPSSMRQAYVAPSVSDLALLPGRLAARLRQWRELESIPANMRSFIKTADLENQIELASMLQPEEEADLGLGAAVRLIHAPARPESHFYWRWCARAIVKGDHLPSPPEPPKNLASSDDLVRAEQVIACADLYLWLARTPEFRSFGPCYEEVRRARYALAEHIDQALLSRLDTRKRCTSCGRVLPLSHHYRLCENCYRDRSYDYWDDDSI